MTNLFNYNLKEKVILAGVLTNYQNSQLFEEDMQEMKMLCKTAGAEIAAVFVQKRHAPEASCYLGHGKLLEISAAMKKLGARTLVVDAELSPGQVRNIEKTICGKVVDRNQLILDIFVKHARTNEAKIQVELAQMRTLYPRLTHAWTHFSQQVGGIGTRGPGEKQLEVDRRLVQRKISELTRRLRKVEKARSTQRKARSKFFNISLVGYTNVGKSSILNSLCGCSESVENKLFSTLDTASRRCFIEGIGTVVISDTVGFLRRLPHHLVASFRSTLEVVLCANLLLIVVDMSSRWIEQQLSTVESVLEIIGAKDIPRIIVFNKADLVKDPFVQKELSIKYPGAYFGSALDRNDMDELKEYIAEYIKSSNNNRSIIDIVKLTAQKNQDSEPKRGFVEM